MANAFEELTVLKWNRNIDVDSLLLVQIEIFQKLLDNNFCEYKQLNKM